MSQLMPGNTFLTTDTGIRVMKMNAIKEFAEVLKNKPYFDEEHNFYAIPIDYIDEVLEEMENA